MRKMRVPPLARDRHSTRCRSKPRSITRDKKCVALATWQCGWNNMLRLPAIQTVAQINVKGSSGADLMCLIVLIPLNWRRPHFTSHSCPAPCCTHATGGFSLSLQRTIVIGPDSIHHLLNLKCHQVTGAFEAWMMSLRLWMAVSISHICPFFGVKLKPQNASIASV